MAVCHCPTRDRTSSCWTAQAIAWAWLGLAAAFFPAASARSAEPELPSALKPAAPKSPAKVPAGNAGQPPAAKPSGAQPKAPAESPETPPAKTPAEETPPPKAKPEESAEEPAAPPKKFYEQQPYDVITLDQTNDNKTFQVVPLAERRMPEESKRIGKLTVQLFDRPGEEYEILWRHIAGIQFFEDLILIEAEKLVGQAAEAGRQKNVPQSLARFDEAYDFYRYLLRYYPHTARLDASLQDYLYLNSGTLFLAGRGAEAFAVLEELYARNPEYRYQGGEQGVLTALNRVGDPLIGAYVEREDYVSARRLLERLVKTYGAKLPAITARRDRMVELATKKRDEASAQLAAGRFREAHDASREMLKMWPQLPGGRELIVEIARRYPLIVVGVSAPALAHDPGCLDNFATRRDGDLVYRTLVRFVERGPEGGRYASPFGQVQSSDDRKQLIFDLDEAAVAARVTGFDLAQNLLAMADASGPRYEPSWAALMASLQVEGVRRVRVLLRRAHVLPQALLGVPFTLTDRPTAKYEPQRVSPSESRFDPVAGGLDADALQPVIVQQLFAEPRQAIEALRKGKIDMIDRLLPVDAMRLKQDPAFQVGSYAFPTLHVLVPNTSKPYPGLRSFRRALVYGINRQVILDKGLLDNQQLAGCRVLSAPVPAGIMPNDPAAYAYDDAVAPAPYDPVMAAILVRLAAQQLAAVAEQRKEQPPELGELVLAHPAGELPRFICKQIQTQWDVVGVKCRLRELPPGQSQVTDGDWDLLFAELFLLEPLADLGRLLGDGGVFASSDPFVSLAIRKLSEVENWKDARLRLQDLHRLLAIDATLIPLWQMIDHYACHRGVQGVRPQPVVFYQDVERWRVVPPEAAE